MIINEKTKIRYTIINEHNEEIQIDFTIEQMEGSTPNFYEQLKNNFENENIKIIKREIIEGD